MASQVDETELESKVEETDLSSTEIEEQSPNTAALLHNQCKFLARSSGEPLETSPKNELDNKYMCINPILYLKSRKNRQQIVKNDGDTSPPPVPVELNQQASTKVKLKDSKRCSRLVGVYNMASYQPASIDFLSQTGDIEGLGDASSIKKPRNGPFSMRYGTTSKNELPSSVGGSKFQLPTLKQPNQQLPFEEVSIRNENRRQTIKSTTHINWNFSRLTHHVTDLNLTSEEELKIDSVRDIEAAILRNEDIIQHVEFEKQNTMREKSMSYETRQSKKWYEFAAH